MSQTEYQDYIDILKECAMRTKKGALIQGQHAWADKLQSNECPTEKGVSLLEVKLHHLLSYNTYLCYYLLLKCMAGYPHELESLKRIQNHPVIQKLIETRLYLEKSKPLENKLKYQIDKLIKAATMADDAGLVSIQDTQVGDDLTAAAMKNPLQFKPDPSQLLDDTQGESMNRMDYMTESQGIYKPPRVAPMHFREEKLKSRQDGYLSEKGRQQALSSSLLHELRHQYDNKPEEMSAEGTGYASSRYIAVTTDGKGGSALDIDKELAEKERFEEDNFIRLNMTKEEKRARKMLKKRGGLLRFQNDFQNINKEFNELRSLHNAVESDPSMKRSTLKASRRITTDSSKKRKYADASDLIARTGQTLKSKDLFKRKLRSAKRMRTRQEE